MKSAIKYESPKQPLEAFVHGNGLIGRERCAMRLASAALLMITISGCAQSAPAPQLDEPASQNTVTITETAAASANGLTDEAAKTTTVGTASASARAEDSAADEVTSFPMPNEIGKVLQDAQDHLQQVSGNPFFVSDSTDATGAGRMQIVDRNWKVCDQNVPQGTLVDENTNISFATVKTGEDCP